MESDLSSLIKATNSKTGNGSEEYSELDNVDEGIEIFEDSDDKDLQEDQIAAGRMVELTGLPLPSGLQFECIEAEIYSCAPGENNTPCYILMDRDFEVLTFPDLFPRGCGGFEVSQQTVKSYLNKSIYKSNC